MDLLEQTIEHLSAEEQSDFKTFLQKQKENRKDLKLFELLASKKDYTPKALVTKLHTTNLNAYHSLRKRLMKELFEFMVLKQLQADATRASSVMGFISMSQFMLKKNAPEVAAYFLKKAETHALLNQQFDLLDSIYHLYISHADKLDTNLNELIEKWQINTEKYKSQQRLSIAYSLIKQQLAEARKRGTVLDVEAIINSVFHDFQITPEDANAPEFMYKLVSMARSAVISAKDYYRFEPFIVRIYTRLSKAGVFTRSTIDFQLGFLYMMAHVYYRNKKFALAEEQLESMPKATSARTFYNSEFFGKYISLKAAIATFSNRNEEAIALLKDTLTDKSLRIATTEKLNMQLNLAVYFFQNEEYKKANKTLLEISHSERWLEEKMGMEWRFKKNMIEVITQVELQHEEIALSKISFIEKHYSVFLKQPTYNRAKFFLSFIKKLINQPQIIRTKEFAEQVKAAQLALPEEKEDLQAITFFAWLKAKMQNKNYYQTLLEVMRTTDYGTK